MDGARDRTEPSGASSPLALGVDRNGWRIHGPAEHTDRRLISAAVQVLQRSRYTCAYCGFKSVPDGQSVPEPGAVELNERACGYLQVHPRHGDHAHWRLEELDAVCPFCHEVLHCGAGGAQDSGLIIACPKLAQRELNLLCNAMAVASAAADANAIVVDQLWAQLEGLQRPVQVAFDVQRLSCGLLAAGLLALRTTSAQLYAARGRALSALRYLPDRRVFAQAVGYWRACVWRPVGEWQEVYRRWTRPFSA